MVTNAIRQRSIGLKVAFTFLAIIMGGILGFAISHFDNPLYIVVGVIGGALFFASIFSVETGLLVLFFLSYTRFSDIAVHYHNAPSIAKSYIFILGVVILIRWAVFRERPQGWQRAAVIIGIYGLVLASSLLYASDTARVSESLNDTAKDVFIAFIVIVLLNSGARLRGVVWSLLIAGIFIGTISVYQYLTGTFGNYYWGFAQASYMQYAGTQEGYRISGPVGDPNFYAMVMLVLVPLALERLLDERSRPLRLAALWALTVIALTVVFTYSRGGFVALAAAIFAWFFLYPLRLKYFPVLILVGVTFLMLIPQEYLARISTLKELISAPSVGFRTQDFALRGRASETLAGLEMIKQHPILGVGVNNYSSNYLDYAKSLGLAPSASERAAHNLYLEVAAETGLVGLSVFLVFLGTMAKNIIDSWKKLRGTRDDLARMVAAIGAGILGYLAASVFIHSAYPRYFWLLVGIAFSIPNIVKNELKEDH
jgi:O-antigen ligase